mmetsp:Transcript_25524/g.70262  ORF Transcript_25524/g.70262 Transcript_25524/m.70262 type:complete len:274 (-) Transcript_25524:361-1182(-)
MTMTRTANTKLKLKLTRSPPKNWKPSARELPPTTRAPWRRSVSTTTTSNPCCRKRQPPHNGRPRIAVMVTRTATTTMSWTFRPPWTTRTWTWTLSCPISETTTTRATMRRKETPWRSIPSISEWSTTWSSIRTRNAEKTTTTITTTRIARPLGTWPRPRPSGTSTRSGSFRTSKSASEIPMPITITITITIQMTTTTSNTRNATISPKWSVSGSSPRTWSRAATPRPSFSKCSNSRRGISSSSNRSGPTGTFESRPGSALGRRRRRIDESIDS